MGEIGSRWKARLAQILRFPSQRSTGDASPCLVNKERDTGRKEEPRNATIIIGSPAMHAHSGMKSPSLAAVPHSYVTNAPGQACVQSGHVDFADQDGVAYPRKRHCAAAESRHGEVQQRLESPAPSPVINPVSHGVHESPTHHRSKMDIGSERYPQHVSVTKQVIPQLHARTLSRLRPALQPRGTQTSPPHMLPRRCGVHDETRGVFVTPPIGSDANGVYPYHSNSALVRPSAVHSEEMTADQRQQNGAHVQSIVKSERVPVTARDGRWGHHLQSYHALDATWSQAQASIEAKEAERRQKAQNPASGDAAHVAAQTGQRAHSPRLQRAMDIVQQVKLDEAEQRSKKAMQDMALALHLSHLRIASDRRQIAVQSVRPARARAEKEPSVPSMPEAEEEEDSGIVDLMSSSDNEGAVAVEGVDVQQSEAVVDLLSSDDEGPGSEDEEGGTERSDASMSDEGLQIDGTDRMLTAPLIAEYRRLTREISGHDPYAIHPRARVAVSGEDLKLCGPSKWVGDACINMYMALLQDRDQEWCASSDSSHARVLFMNSHFLAKLCQEATGYQYSNVARWTRATRLKSNQLTYTGIKDLDKVVVPVHLGNHWTCAVLNFRDCQIEYYDSLRGVDTLTINSLLRWAQDEYADKYGGEVPERFRAQSWKTVFNPSGTPEQMNGFDCGVFCMMCCNYAGADKAFDYGQAEIHSFFRAMCAIECGLMRLRLLDA
eukprot:jgi/Ulvmu1/5599/UM023_0136.1